MKNMKATMNKAIIILGAGGHAKVCIELLQAMGETVAYCISEATDPNDFCLNIPILKGEQHLDTLSVQGYHRAFVAIGSNDIRERLALLVCSLGYDLVNAISLHSIISPSVTLGKGLAIMPGAIINANTTIEDLAIINTGATVDHDCKISRATHIAPQCGLAGQVSVGKHSLLGIGCKVIPGITIGEQATIGAGAVIINNIPSYSTAIGVPAQVIEEKIILS